MILTLVKGIHGVNRQKRIMFLVAALVLAILSVLISDTDKSSRGHIEFNGRYYHSLEELFEENSDVIGCGPRMTTADAERGYYDAREGMQTVCFSSEEESDNLYRQNQALRDNYEANNKANAALQD